MEFTCIWEHNHQDTLLHVAELPGACVRGASLEEALGKLESEIRSCHRWLGLPIPEHIDPILLDSPSALDIRDADSDVLFPSEREPLSLAEYELLRDRCLRSARDFQTLYESIPDKNRAARPARRTFYGNVPRTAEEMYRHTRSVNDYYFAEIEVPTDQDGTIAACRKRGFDALEQHPDFLGNALFEGSYGESWTLRKVLRRFLWHDRIHARAMYRMAISLWGEDRIPNPFCF